MLAIVEDPPPEKNVARRDVPLMPRFMVTSRQEIAMNTSVPKTVFAIGAAEMKGFTAASMQKLVGPIRAALIEKGTVIEAPRTQSQSAPKVATTNLLLRKRSAVTGTEKT
jgi:hypothetical protein